MYFVIIGMAEYENVRAVKKISVQICWNESLFWIKLPSIQITFIYSLFVCLFVYLFCRLFIHLFWFNIVAVLLNKIAFCDDKDNSARKKLKSNPEENCRPWWQCCSLTLLFNCARRKKQLAFMFSFFTVASKIQH